MTCQPAAPILEGLDLHLDIAEGGLVANAILIAKVIGDDAVARAWQDHVSTISVHLAGEKSVLINRDHVVYVEVCA